MDNWIDNWKGLTTSQDCTCLFCKQPYYDGKSVIPCCDKAEEFRKHLDSVTVNEDKKFRDLIVFGQYVEDEKGNHVDMFNLKYE